MRHNKKFNHLSRSASSRRALLSSLAESLILKKRIITTLAKAKALRKFVEPIITKSKVNTTHSRRMVFSVFQHKNPVKELFDNISSKIVNRPGGYTRIIKLSQRRAGDNAEMSMIELVDFNTLYNGRKKSKSRTRRGRGKSIKHSKSNLGIDTVKNANNNFDSTSADENVSSKYDNVSSTLSNEGSSKLKNEIKDKNENSSKNIGESSESKPQVEEKSIEEKKPIEEKPKDENNFKNETSETKTDEST